eukprot:TRINITY_DN69676_c0_g1_i1.p1 TRINITY_DN69676_c0_g1~~TRINITY_DN69676_c0_g1_i1.p1  ORF type:complete len:183 (+),score=21.50 TRINITY_DN69676_c0_g1_i1:202-750(+)
MSSEECPGESDGDSRPPPSPPLPRTNSRQLHNSSARPPTVVSPVGASDVTSPITASSVQRIEELERANASLKAQVATLQAQNEALTARAAAAETEASSLRSRSDSHATAERERVLRERVTALEEDVRRTQRDRAELIGAFRKQARLVDVLRRQKLHAEAATLLRLSEAEFRRALQMNSGDAS